MALHAAARSGGWLTGSISNSLTPLLTPLPDIRLALTRHWRASLILVWWFSSLRLFYSTQSLKDLQCKLLDAAAAPFIHGNSLLHRIESAHNLVSTGNEHLDSMLEGGFHVGELVEIIGSAAAGKTQACLAAAAAAAQHGRAVLYIDSNGSFSALRVLEQAGISATQDGGGPAAALLAHIHVQMVFDIHELLQALHHFGQKLAAGEAEVALLVVDSIASLALPTLSSSHDQGHTLLTAAGRTLLQIAHDHNAACLVTNYVVFSRDQAGRGKAALGNSWVSIPSMRLVFEKASDTDTYAEVLKSTRLPAGLNTTYPS